MRLRIFLALLFMAAGLNAQQSITNVSVGNVANDWQGYAIRTNFMILNTNTWYLYDLVGSTTNDLEDFIIAVRDDLQAQINGLAGTNTGISAETATNIAAYQALIATNKLSTDLLAQIATKVATNGGTLYAGTIQAGTLADTITLVTNSALWLTPGMYFTNVGNNLHLVHTNYGRVFGVVDGALAGNAALLTNLPLASVTGLTQALTDGTNNTAASVAQRVSTNETRYVTLDGPRLNVLQTNFTFWTNSGVPTLKVTKPSDGSYTTFAGDQATFYSPYGGSHISALFASHFGGDPGGQLALYDTNQTLLIWLDARAGNARAVSVQVTGWTDTTTNRVLVSGTGKTVLESQTLIEDLATDEEAVQAALNATNAYNTHVTNTYSTKTETTSATNLVMAVVHTKAGTNAPTIFNPTFSGATVNYGTTDIEGTSWSIDGATGYIVANLFSGPHSGNGASLTDISKGGVVGLVDALGYFTNSIVTTNGFLTSPIALSDITPSGLVGQFMKRWGDDYVVTGINTVDIEGLDGLLSAAVKTNETRDMAFTGDLRADNVSFAYITNRNFSGDPSHILVAGTDFTIQEHDQTIDNIEYYLNANSNAIPTFVEGDNITISSNNVAGKPQYTINSTVTGGDTITTYGPVTTTGTTPQTITVATGLTSGNVFAGSYAVTGISSDGLVWKVGHYGVARGASGTVGYSATGATDSGEGDLNIEFFEDSGSLKCRVTGATGKTMHWTASGWGHTHSY